VPIPVGHKITIVARVPDRAILRDVRPIAVSVQVRTAGHACDKGRRSNTDATHRRLLAGQHRRQKAVADHRAEAGLERRGRAVAGNSCSLARQDLQRDVVAGQLGRALDNRHGRGVLGVAGNYFVASDGGDGDDAAGRLDAVAVARREVLQMQVARALRQARRQRVVIQLRNVELGGLIKGDPVTCDLQIGVGASLDPERAAGGDGQIQHRLIPPIGIREMKGYSPVDSGKAANAGRRVDDGRRLCKQRHNRRDADGKRYRGCPGTTAG
jgi:hypothetical protein